MTEGIASAGDAEDLDPDFEGLVVPAMERAYRLALVMLNDPAAAEDAVQEAAIKAWRRLGDLTPGRDPKPWFIAIVANECRMLRRGRWWSVLHLKDLAGVPPAQGPALADVVDGAAVRAAVHRLPHDQRLVVALRYYLDLPLDEIAAVTDVPLGTVKSRLHRATNRLRVAIGGVEAHA